MEIIFIRMGLVGLTVGSSLVAKILGREADAPKVGIRVEVVVRIVVMVRIVAVVSEILVSPAEHDPLILALGNTSPLPERFGCDMMWVAQGERWGVQRKTVADLCASVEDDRLGKELGQARVGHVNLMIIVEGRAAFTPDGTMLGSGYGRPWTQKGWWGVQFAVQHEGARIMHARDPRETAEMTRALKVWSEKPHHGGWGGRVGPRGMWGSAPTDIDWGVHVLTSFPGIGPELARAIWAKFGRVPLEWIAGEEELMAVKGLGKKRVRMLMRALGATGD